MLVLNISLQSVQYYLCIEGDDLIFNSKQYGGRFDILYVVRYLEERDKRNTDSWIVLQFPLYWEVVSEDTWIQFITDVMKVKLPICSWNLNVVCSFVISAPAAAPGNLTVVNISANELNVSWERPNERDINGMLRYYILKYYTVNQNGNTISANISGNTHSKILRGLNNFTSYNVSVAAFTIDAGPFSTEVETTSENGGLIDSVAELPTI